MSMDAKAYMKKCATICRLFDESGRCSECPLMPFSCGTPMELDKQEAALIIVEEFQEPPEPYVCPKCRNDHFPTDAAFCFKCGLPIEVRQ